MMTWLPLIATAVLCLITTFGCLKVRPYIYSMGQAPYTDIGFEFTPDLSNSFSINIGFGALYAALLAAFCCFLAHAVTLVRRLMFIFFIAQVVQVVQCFSTIFPEPNPTVEADEREYSFVMAPLLYGIGLLTVQFYSRKTILLVVAYAMTLLGLWLIIATRYLYTIDMLSALIAGVFPFLIYHWYIRNAASIAKRPFLVWMEQDAIQEWNRRQEQIARAQEEAEQHAAKHRLRMGNPSANPVLEASCVIEFVEPEFGEAHAAGIDLQHFHTGSFEGTELERMEEELFQQAEQMTPYDRRKWLVLSLLIGIGTWAVCGIVCGFGLKRADIVRPVNVTLPSDLLYPYLPTIPPHTPDYFLYSMLGVVCVYALWSPQRIVIFRRTFFMLGILWLLRTMTFTATSPPDPSSICVAREHETGTTCGDMIFSGHAISFFLAGYVVQFYCTVLIAQVIAWAWVALGLVCVVASRFHYTRDVTTALIVINCFVHLVHVTVFWRPDRKLKYRFLFLFELDEIVSRLSCQPVRLSRVGSRRLPPHGHTEPPAGPDAEMAATPGTKADEQASQKPRAASSNGASVEVSLPSGTKEQEVGATPSANFEGNGKREALALVSPTSPKGSKPASPGPGSRLSTPKSRIASSPKKKPSVGDDSEFLTASTKEETPNGEADPQHDNGDLST